MELTLQDITKAVGEGCEAGLKDVKTQIEALKGEIGEVSGRMTDGEGKSVFDTWESKIKALETALSSKTGPPGMQDDIDEDARKGKSFKLLNVYRYLITGNEKYAEYEIGKCKEWRQTKDGQELVGMRKALSTEIDEDGGFVVPTQYLAQEFIPLLKPRVIAMQLGARQLTGLVGAPIEIPKQTAGATAGWFGENATITESTSTKFGQVKGTPKELAAFQKISNRLVRQSDPSVNAIVQMDLSDRIGEVLDLALHVGTGSSNQPQGIVNTPGVGTALTLATVTVEELMDFESAPAERDAVGRANGWGMAQAGWNIIRKLKDSDGRFHFVPDVSQGANRSILGWQVQTTTQLATTRVIYGDWADLLILIWGAMEFAVSTQAGDSFEKNQTWIRAIMMVDAAVRHGESFQTVDDLSA